MEDIEIINKVNEGIKSLFKNDFWLLNNDLNERSITHKLAEYLQTHFIDYNVDCEYNGDIARANEGSRKKISAIWHVLRLANRLTVSELQNQNEDDIVQRLVYPDIIIHKRGLIESNLCIIEVKKSTSQISEDYDIIKLNCYTSDTDQNLNYDLGIFINFNTSSNELKYSMKFFKNGEEVLME